MNDVFTSRHSDSRPQLAHETAYNTINSEILQEVLKSVLFLVRLAIGLGTTGNHS